MKKNIFSVLVFLIPIVSYSQRSIEFTLGAGVTIIDIEKLVLLDENIGSEALDWETTSFGISGQYFISTSENIAFGGELMYQSLYWYSVRVPYVPNPIYRDYSISTVRITPIIRMGGANAFNFDLGPEFNFSDGLSIGVLASANYNIAISDKIDIPLKLRLDIMNQIVTTIPVSINVGVRIKM